jgi:hypothetical protein
MPANANAASIVYQVWQRLATRNPIEVENTERHDHPRSKFIESDSHAWSSQ